VVSDVPVDDETPLVTSKISRPVGTRSFGGAHRGRVCVCVFIWVSVRAYCKGLRCTVCNLKQESGQKRIVVHTFIALRLWAHEYIRFIKLPYFS
jgi:hypothetical protein